MPPAALTNQLLLDPRWLLGGTCKDPSVRNHHAWNQILTVTSEKQEVFIQRVLTLHDISLRRSGKSTPVRLSLAEWLAECDRMCLLTFVAHEMKRATDDNGHQVFTKETLDTVVNRIVEGSLG